MWFGKSRLRKAIERGLENGKLHDEIEELGELSIKSKADADAICWGLNQLESKSRRVPEDTYELAGLFQQVPDGECDAVEVLRDGGIPKLIKLYDFIAAHDTGDRPEDKLLFLLKIMAMYGTTEGALKVVEAARQPLEPDGYMWSVILGGFSANHPEVRLVLESLADPLPEAFIAVSLLDAANRARLDGAEIRHPFDSNEGVRRIRTWLESIDPDEFSYAQSATAALPFLTHPERDELLNVALNHSKDTVRIEAAWVMAKLGQERGLSALARHCLDFNHGLTAQRYLDEVGRADLIPEEARTPDAQALAQFANWLQHPNELGQPPDELEIVDHRQLAWPPEREGKPFWLIRYKLRDRTGLEDDNEECGLVGSMTFCFFSYKLLERPPEDGYAIHCYWEMEHHDLIEETDVEDNAAEYAGLLQEWTGPTIANAAIRYVAELSPELKYPQRLVALASGKLGNEEGWLVLDGPRSRWYPRSDMPDAFESLALKIHVGRQLLGFGEENDRKRYVKATPPERTDDQIIEAYSRGLADALRLTGKARERALGKFGTLDTHFDAYVDALGRRGRSQDVRAVIEVIAPSRDNNRGYHDLGNAAYRWGHIDLAEQFFTKLRSNCRPHGEEMSWLAEIWHRRGQHQQAKELLIDVMKTVVEESKADDDPDLDRLDAWLQTHRATFARLFPEESDEALRQLGIPDGLQGKG